MIKSKEEEFTKEIDEALKLHSLYDGNYSKKGYLQRMDGLVIKYRIKGSAPAPRISNMLDIYYQKVGVKNLHEAFERIRRIEEGKK